MEDLLKTGSKPNHIKDPFLKPTPGDFHNFPFKMSVQSFGLVQLNLEQFYIMKGKNEYKHVSVQLQDSRFLSL